MLSCRRSLDSFLIGSEENCGQPCRGFDIEPTRVGSSDSRIRIIIRAFDFFICSIIIYLGVDYRTLADLGSVS